MKKLLLASVMALSLSAYGVEATAHESTTTGYSDGIRADSHAPIGVMGDHMHNKGEWMLSYRMMHGEMEDSRDGTSDLSPETIATTIPNRFFGNPGQPATLRMVPLRMEKDVHMVGAMYAPSDVVTLMAMGKYIDKEMEMLVFQGGAGTNTLGTTKAQSKGFGDVKMSSHIRLFENANHHVHLNAGLSLPTGSIKKSDTVLTPMNMQSKMRLAYGMQLGSGTYDVLPGLTYTGHGDKWGWGAQYMGTLRLGRNSQDYSLGNKHQVTAWGSYLFTPAVSLSARITGDTEGKIDGMDSNIMGASQTADPDNYGGKRISASLGLNTVVTGGVFKGHRFSIEGTLPVYQNLNGPQLKRDSMIVVGWSKSF
jgi:hypothetical protein